MGAITGVHEVAASTNAEMLTATQTAREVAISGAMAQLRDLGVLSQPSFTGDVETALIYFMGERAFDEQVSAPYIDLAARLDTEAARVSAEATASGMEIPRFPVVLVLKETDERGNPAGFHSAVASIKPGAGHFSSARSRLEGMSMHYIDGEPIAGVTKKRFSLTGAVGAFDGNVYDTLDPIKPASGKTGIELPLAESLVADHGLGTNLMFAYAFHDSRVNYLEDEPRILVGWTEIEESFIGRLAKRVENGSWYRDARTIRTFFGAVYTPETLREGSPRLADIVDAVNAFDAAIGGVVTPPVEA